MTTTDIIVEGFDFGTHDVVYSSTGTHKADPTFLSIANKWRANGFVVIPGTIDKRPQIPFKAYTGENAGTPVPQHTIEAWAKYPSPSPILLLDSNPNCPLVVIDVDADVEVLTNWVFNTFGQTPLQVETGRAGGGRHLYYRLRPGESLAQKNGVIGPDSHVCWAEDNGKKSTKWGRTPIDCKSKRSYAIAPGAFHKSGRQYMPIGVNLDDIDLAWILQNVPLLDLTVFHNEADKANQRKQAQRQAFIKAHTKLGSPTTGLAVIPTTKRFKKEPFIQWCKQNPQDVNLELWWGLACNLADYYPEEQAEALFHELSAIDVGRYDKVEAANTWTRALAAVKSGGGVSSYATLESHGYTGEIPIEKSPSALLKSLAGPSFAVAGKEKTPLPCDYGNTKKLLEFSGWEVKDNQMTHQVEFSRFGMSVSPDLAGSIIRNSAREYRYPLRQAVYDDHILEISQENSYHPVLAWLGGEKWDGIDRIPTLGHTLSVNPHKYRNIHDQTFCRWVLGAAAALVKPDGVKAEGVLVLAGPQGCGKTSWFASLAPVGVLTGASLDPSDKDSVIHATSSWLVELGELDATFRRADLARLKAFLSQTEDRIRLPYGRAERSMPRRTVFMASVNDEEYLQDRTGNRRYWTFPVTQCNAYHGIDMKQLWLQAIHLVRSGERWWLDANEMADLNASNMKHTEMDPIMAAILEHYDLCPTYWVPQSEVRELVRKSFSTWGRMESLSLVKNLRLLGAERVGRNGRDGWGLKPKVTTQQDEMDQAVNSL